MFLEQDGVIQVTSAASGKEALQLLEKESYDCIVSDYKMPGMDGITFARQVRERSQIPFIIYTRQGSEEVAESAFMAGVDNYVRKEVEPSHYLVLARNIKNIVERRWGEDQYVEVSENSRDAITIIQGDRVVYANKAMAELTGVDSPADLIGSDSSFQVVDEDKKRVQEIRFARQRGEPAPSRYEFSFRRTDGEVRRVEVSASMITFRGKPASLSFIHDITDRKRVDDELKESEERYRTLVESSPNAVSVTVGDTIVYANQRRAELAGVDDPSELVGTSAFSQVAEADRESIVERREARERGGKPPSPFEYRMLRADGSIRDLMDYNSEIIYQGKNAVHHVLLDITEQKRYEKRLETLYWHASELQLAGNVQQVCELTLDGMEQVLGFEDSSFLLVEKGILKEKGARGTSILDIPLPLDGKGITVKAANTRQTVLVNDLRGDPDFVRGPIDSLSELAAPVLIDGETVAVLNIESLDLNAFTRGDQRLLETLAQHVALVLSRLASMEMLRASEERYRTFLESSRDAVFVLDDNAYIYVNRAAADMLGYDYPEEIIGLPSYSVIAPEEREEVMRRTVARVRGEAVTNRYEIKLLRRDGGVVLCEANTSRIMFEGKPVSLSMDRDITERKKFEEALLESEERFRGIAERSFDPIILVDLGGHITYASPSAGRITGYKPEEFIGKSFTEFFQRSKLSVSSKALSEVVKGRVVKGLQLDVVRGDRSTAYVEVNASPIIKGGEVVGAQVIVRDITERRRYVDQIHALHSYAVRLGEATDIPEVYDITFQAMTEIIGYRRCSILVVEDGVLRDVHLKGYGEDVKWNLPLDGKGLTVRAARTGETLYVPDVRLDPDYIEATPGVDVKSELALPVKVHGEVVAVLNVERSEVDAFTEEDRRLLEILASHTASAIVRLRQVADLREHEERLAVLQHSTVGFHKAESVEDISAQALDTMEETLRFNHAGFAIVDDDVVRYVGVRGIEVPLPMVLPIDGRSVTARIVRTGRASLIPDVRLEEDFVRSAPEEFYTLSELAVPVKVDGGVVAVLNAESDRLNAFDEQDQRLMEILASHVASAISRIRHLESERAYQAKLEALHRHSTELGEAETVGEVAELTLSAVEGVLGFDQGGFGVVEGSVLRFTHLIGVGGVFELPLDGPGVTVRAVKTGEAQLVADIRKDEDYVLGPAEGIYEASSELAVPVKVGGVVVAVINVESEQFDAFMEEDRTLVEAFAEHVASAIVRLRLLESERRGREKLAALHASATKLSEAPDLDSVWRIVVETLTGVLGFGVVSIGVVDGDSVRFTRTRGVTLPEGLSIRLDQPSVSARAIRTLKTQLVNDVSADPDYFSAVFGDDGKPVMKSDLVVPVIIDGKAEAVINVESPEPGAFTEEDVRLAETLGTHASSAISRVRRVETLKRLVEEKTAELLDADQLATAGRISATVAHDLKSPLQVIRNAATIIKMKPNLTDKMLETIEESCARADKMLESFRSDTRVIPLNIEAVDLGALIRAVLEESPPPAKVKVEIEVGKNLEAVQLDAFRVRRVLDNLVVNALEAMPEGGNLAVSAEMVGSEAIIKISDTGVGIPEAELPKLFKAFHTMKPKGLGLGLAFCRRAVEAHGGSITVESKVGEGTTFTVTLPLHPMV